MDQDTISVEHASLQRLLADTPSDKQRSIAARLTEHVHAEREALHAALEDERSSPHRARYESGIQRLVRAVAPDVDWDRREIAEAFREHVSSCTPMLELERVTEAQPTAESVRPDGASDADESWSAHEPAEAEHPDRSVQAVVDRTQARGSSPAQE